MLVKLNCKFKQTNKSLKNFLYRTLKKKRLFQQILFALFNLRHFGPGQSKLKKPLSTVTKCLDRLQICDMYVGQNLSIFNPHYFVIFMVLASFVVTLCRPGQSKRPLYQSLTQIFSMLTPGSVNVQVWIQKLFSFECA